MAYVEVSDNEDTAKTSKGNDFSCNVWRWLVYTSALEEARGGDSHMKMTGMLVGKLELNP